MRVTTRLTMQEYDSFCREHLRGKIPKWRSSEFIERVGDCIYDFSGPGQPILRPTFIVNRIGQSISAGRTLSYRTTSITLVIIQFRFPNTFTPSSIKRKGISPPRMSSTVVHSLIGSKV
jgi:hypothetical protein